MSTSVPILAPPPVVRPVLQPSVHARGVRPFVYSGAIDDWHAPGALVRNGVTKCAVDAAWLVEPVLGPARKAPPVWPGVPGARERAIAYGKHVGLYSYQQEGAAFLAERDYAGLFDAMGCVEGTAVVRCNRAGRSFKITLAELYQRENLLKGSWDPAIRTHIRVLAGDTLRLHPIVAVLRKGVRSVLKLVLQSGKTLRLTPDHEVAVSVEHFVRADQLVVGGAVLTNGAVGTDEVVHHKNGVKTDNHSENPELTTATNHMKHHGRAGGFKHLHGGSTINGGVVQFVPVVDYVASVEPDGEADVYDIVCADPHRNFVANGVVVHNCGKTPQALIAAEARLSFAAIPSATTPVVLIICPALAKRHWQREVKKWTGHEAEVLETLTPTDLPDTRYIICNYDILYGAQRRDAAGVKHDVEHLPGWAGQLTNFLVVIIDEAHAFRGRDSRRTKTARKMLMRTPVVWALTGTPMPNYVRDLWALLDLISDGLWGPSYWTWAKSYTDATQGTYGWKDTGASNTEILGRRMGFFCLGRSQATAGLELPEKRREIYKIDVTMTAPTVHEGHKALTKSGFVAKALRATAYAKRSAVVAQTVEALENQQKVVVFVYMREQADAVYKAVKDKVDCPVACVHGDLSPDGRDAQATAFREIAAPAAFIATIDSVGVAISLVGADLVLYGDIVPEPWKLLQSEKRCHRHGSTKRVLVRYLIGTGTLDEAVAETVIEKLSTIESALGQDGEQQELSGMLGGDRARTDEAIMDGLFSRLQSMAKEQE